MTPHCVVAGGQETREGLEVQTLGQPGRHIKGIVPLLRSQRSSVATSVRSVGTRLGGFGVDAPREGPAGRIDGPDDTGAIAHLGEGLPVGDLAIGHRPLHRAVRRARHSPVVSAWLATLGPSARTPTLACRRATRSSAQAQRGPSPRRRRRSGAKGGRRSFLGTLAGVATWPARSTTKNMTRSRRPRGPERDWPRPGWPPSPDRRPSAPGLAQGASGTIDPVVERSAQVAAAACATHFRGARARGG